MATPVPSDDRVLVLIGASGGIGEGIVRLAAAKHFSHTFVLVARRQAELERVAKELGPDVRTLVVVADATSRADLERVKDEALRAFGRIDVWVNNAGRGSTIMPSQLTGEAVDDMININVKSALYGTQVAIEAMKLPAASGAGIRGGHILNVSSLLGRALQLDPKIPTHFRCAYGPSKAFVSAMTDAFRMELRADDATRDRITITTVHPGPVATDFGLNAKGPDSRGFSGAETVEDCCEAIYQRALVEKREEMYTREDYLPRVHAYLDRLASARPSA